MKTNQMLSIMLSVLMVLSCVLPAMPVTAESNDEPDTSFSTSNITVGGTNSFGTMVSNTLKDAQSEQLQGNGNNIYSIEMNGKTASVSFHTVTYSTLIVAVYDESSVKMLGSGNKAISEQDTSAEIEIAIDEMPAYYYVRGYIVDSNTLEPLSIVFDCPNYTKEMQEFFSKTTKDFDRERVLNLDDDTDNNFAVFKEDTIILTPETGYDKVITADDENAVYVFENPDNTLLSLKEDDIFSYTYDEDKTLIVKVASLQQDGDRVTINGAKAEMTEVFEFTRIEFDGMMKEESHQEQHSNQAEALQGSSPQRVTHTDYLASKLIGPIDESFGSSFTVTENFHKDTFYDKDGIKAGISGSVSLSVGITMKLYISWSYQYVELAFNYTTDINFTVSGSVEVAVPLTADPMCYGKDIGFYIKIVPEFVIRASGSVTLDIKWIGKWGFGYSPQSGFKDLSENDTKAEARANLELFIGLRFNPTIKMINESFCDFEMNGEVGIKITASAGKSTKDFITPNDNVYHDCLLCLNGSVKFVGNYSYKADFFIGDKLTWDAPKAEYEICKFYYSGDHDEWGFGGCPHKNYRVTLHVTEPTSKDAEGVTVTFSPEGKAKEIKNLVPVNVSSMTTDAKGNVTFFAPAGLIYATCTKDGKEWKVPIAITSLIKNKYFVNMSGTHIVDLMLEEKLDESKTIVDSDDTKDNKEESTQKNTITHNRLSLGGNHSAFIDEDGNLYTWGNNEYGQLGDGTTETRYTPIKIMENVVSVCLGGNHSAAITSDGSLYTWGSNKYGQLGDGTYRDQYLPSKIMENVVSVSLGDLHSAAITTEGFLYTWGSNWYGQLGDGIKEYRRGDGTEHTVGKPAVIMDNVSIVSLGGYHSAAITTDGVLYTWGADKSFIPVKLMNNVANVSLGLSHGAAITTEGNLYMWGNNKHGQLGDGTYNNSDTPIKIMDNVVYISLGISKDHSAAITTDGSLYTWGGNDWGQLGNGTRQQQSSPIKIMDNVAAVSLGRDYGSAAITTDGSVYTWGCDWSGKLGHGIIPTIPKYIPTKITIPSEQTENITIQYTLAAKASANGQALIADLVPGNIYNFYCMASTDSENLFAPENLLYINQYIADENGTITVDYEPTKQVEGAQTFVKQIKTIGGFTLGDVDSSGGVDILDVIKANKFVLGVSTLTEEQQMVADVDDNGTVDASDSLIILKYALQIITSFDLV